MKSYKNIIGGLLILLLLSNCSSFNESDRNLLKETRDAAEEAKENSRQTLRLVLESGVKNERFFKKSQQK